MIQRWWKAVMSCLKPPTFPSSFRNSYVPSSRGLLPAQVTLLLNNSINLSLTFLNCDAASTFANIWLASKWQLSIALNRGIAT